MVKEEDKMPNIEGLEFYIDAFNELSTCRGIGMDIGPIPFTSIYEYSKIYDVDDFDEFLYVIRRMDSVVMKHKETKSKGMGNGNAANKNNTSSRRR